MEAIVFVLGLAAVGALALRFGQDSREGMRGKEQDLAGYGVTWADLQADRAAPAATPPRPAQSYPTLSFIEQVLGTAGLLTADPNAPLLEARARQLTEEWWSDLVWTTGVVPDAAFRRALAEVAPGLADAPALPVDGPIAVVEPAPVVPPAIERERPAAAPDRAPSLSLAGSPATA